MMRRHQRIALAMAGYPPKGLTTLIDAMATPAVVSLTGYVRITPGMVIPRPAPNKASILVTSPRGIPCA